MNDAPLHLQCEPMTLDPQLAAVHPERAVSFDRSRPQQTMHTDNEENTLTSTDTSFSASSVKLSELLNNAKKGKLQLPDFQRGGGRKKNA